MPLIHDRIKEITVTGDFRLGPDCQMHMTRGATLPVSTTLNSRAHSGKNLVMTGAGAARTHTLPRATGSGRRYKFYVGAVNTSGYIIKSSNGLDVMKGSMMLAGATVSAFTAAATSDTFTLNGTTTGGVSVGDWVEFVDLQANVWAVTGVVTYSGTAGSPFSDTVA